MLNIEGKLIKNPQILAETFNNYLSNVVEAWGLGEVLTTPPCKKHC